MNKVFTAFKQQAWFIKSTARFKGAFAGKRGGKTEVGAVEVIKHLESKPGWTDGGVDPFLAVICAPTHDMLKRLSWKKFMAYASGFVEKDWKTPLHAVWHDGSEILGVSLDRPERLEGVKASIIWIDEVFQVSEQAFLECMARVADSEGTVICTGSLGTQYINPKQHWAYKYFKEDSLEGFECFEWTTADNPYFPKSELERLKKTLDRQTYEQMFTINWDVNPASAVYSDFSETNVVPHAYDPKLPTYLSVDWGWAHPMAAGFFQYNPRLDTVYLFDEIVRSEMKIEELFNAIRAKGYRIDGFFADAAGNQTREQLGISNIEWFRKRGIRFKYRRTAIIYGIPIVRSYIKDASGRIRFYVDPKCKKSIEGLKAYRYQEKDGTVTNENPIKVNDDACDMIRYFFVNRLDPNYSQPKPFEMQER